VIGCDSGVTSAWFAAGQRVPSVSPSGSQVVAASVAVDLCDYCDLDLAYVHTAAEHNDYRLMSSELRRGMEVVEVVTWGQEVAASGRKVVDLEVVAVAVDVGVSEVEVRHSWIPPNSYCGCHS
jgi:hypothetical protein